MAQVRGLAKSSIIGIVVLSSQMNVSLMDEEFTDFSPAEIEAMRFAYRQMLEGFSNGFVIESENRQLARSILEALGRPATTEGVEQVLKQVQRDNTEPTPDRDGALND